MRVAASAGTAHPAPLDRVRVPRQRGPRGVAVAPDRQRPVPAGRRIDDLPPRHPDVAHPDLLAVVQEWRAAKGEQQHRGGLRHRVAVSRARHTRDMPGLVVVGEDDRRPPVRAERRLALVDGRRQRLRPPGGAAQGEVEDQVPRAGVAGSDGGHAGEQLAHAHAPWRSVEQRPEIGQEVTQLRLVLVEDVSLAVPGPDAAGQAARVGSESGVLEEDVEHVEPEPVHAAREPEADHVQHGGGDFGVAPVQVRLLGREDVEVVLAAPLVPRPRRSAKERGPVVRGPPPPARPAPVVPHVPVRVRAGAVRAGGNEPRVQVAGVVHDQVDDHGHLPIVGSRHQPIEVFHRPESRVDRLVVGDVVADVEAR